MASKRYKKLPEKTKDLSAETIEKLLPELEAALTAYLHGFHLANFVAVHTKTHRGDGRFRV